MEEISVLLTYNIVPYSDYPQAQTTYQMFLKSEQLFTYLWSGTPCGVRLKSVVKQIIFKREEARQLNYWVEIKENL